MLIVAFAGCALALRAEDPPASLDTSTVAKAPASSQRDVPVERRLSPLKFGKSDYFVSGPLVDTFRLKPRVQAERSLGRRILDLPIINIFVPEPWPKPARQGKYFAWGESGVPWSAVVERPRSGPQGVLVSVSR